MPKRKLKPETIMKLIDLHEAWVNNKPNGKKLTIHNAIISDVKIQYRNLAYANFDNTEFHNVVMDHTSLQSASFKHANLDRMLFLNNNMYDANLADAKISCTTISHAKCRFACLNNTEFDHVTFQYTDFESSSFENAKISDSHIYASNFDMTKLYNVVFENTEFDKHSCYGAYIKNPSIKNTTGLPPMACPKKGSFIAYMPVSVSRTKLDAIAELYIPETAKRCSGTTRRCRVSRAKIVAFYDIKGRKLKDKVAYQIGQDNARCATDKYVKFKASTFDNNRWNDYSTGIHCYMSFDEANWFTA